MARFTAVYEPESEEAPSETVVRAVADARNEQPDEMEACLYDAVDPDALDALVAPRPASRTPSGEPEDSTATAESPPANLSVSFAFDGVRVAVDGTGRVYLADPTGAPETSAAPATRPVASTRSR